MHVALVSLGRFVGNAFLVTSRSLEQLAKLLDLKCDRRIGFPSYYADSLLIIASSITHWRCPRIERRDLLHACPGSPLSQVRLRYGPSTSYYFLQTRRLASDALVNWVLFPVDRARAQTTKDWSCQLCWANKKTRANNELARGYMHFPVSCRV